MERWKEYFEDLRHTDGPDQEEEAQEVIDWRTMESVKEENIEEAKKEI